MATDLGKISCTPRGAWSASTAYDVLDIVKDGNAAYVAKQTVPVGTPTSDTVHWMKLVSDGSGGGGGAVDSVNGQTGAVNLTANDVNALPITGGELAGNLKGKYGTFTWLMTTAVTEKPSCSKIAVIDDAGWIYYISKSTLVQDVINAIPAAEGGSY